MQFKPVSQPVIDAFYATAMTHPLTKQTIIRPIVNTVVNSAIDCLNHYEDSMSDNTQLRQFITNVLQTKESTTHDAYCTFTNLLTDKLNFNTNPTYTYLRYRLKSLLLTNHEHDVLDDLSTHTDTNSMNQYINILNNHLIRILHLIDDMQFSDGEPTFYARFRKISNLIISDQMQPDVDALLTKVDHTRQLINQHGDFDEINHQLIYLHVDVDTTLSRDYELFKNHLSNVVALIPVFEKYA